MAQTTVLGLSASNYAATQRSYSERVEDDYIENFNKDRLDGFAGSVTASFVETFYVSGAIGTHLGQGGVHGGEYYGGLRYNPMGNRHITKVLAFAAQSGSGGVTTIDVQKKAGLPGTNESLFSNLAFKVNLSASAGAATAVQTTTFAPTSQSWAAGQFLGVVLQEAAAGAGLSEAQDLVVQVHWIPSASYG